MLNSKFSKKIEWLVGSMIFICFRAARERHKGLEKIALCGCNDIYPFKISYSDKDPTIPSRLILLHVCGGWTPPATLLGRYEDCPCGIKLSA